jgi:SpoVK/Ycf46/Vps4 family AAA+-type ATPase
MSDPLKTKTALTSHRNARLIQGSSARERQQAATRVALSMGKQLHRVDLGQVVSKYIGETEKNLSRLFDRAESSNSILFFDEADALFGKRSEVKDAHDRYAGLENPLYRIEVHDSGHPVLLGTSQQNDSLAKSQAALPLQFKWSRPEEQQRARHVKWPP